MNYDDKLMLQTFINQANIDEEHYLDLEIPEADFDVNSKMHSSTVPLKEMEPTFAHYDWMAKLKSSEDPMILSLLNQLTYLCICNGYRQGTIADMTRFGQNAKLADITSVTLMAAIFGSHLIMSELASHLKCAEHEIVFPQSVYEMRKFLLDNYVTRTYAKQGENVDYDWFHHAETKKAELTWDIQSKSYIRTILSVEIKTKELVLDISRLAEIIQAKNKRNAQSQTFIEMNELNHNVRDEFRIFSCLNQLENRLNTKVFGQKEAVNAVTSLIGSSFGKSSKGPLGIATFVGQPDSGKTMLAETLCDELNGTFRLGFQLTVINMEQFSDDQSAMKLLGSGSQYVNSSLGDITAPVFAYPRQIIILDEIEKAHPTAIQSLLTILGKGEMRDATNRRLSRYNQCIFILTSNLGQQVLNNPNMSNITPDLESVLSNGVKGESLSPELVSRLKSGYVGCFKPLTPKYLLKIAENEFEKFKRENYSSKVIWPECFPELVLFSLAGNASPRTIKTRFGTLKSEILRYATSKVEFNKSPLKISASLTSEKLRIAVLKENSFLDQLNFPIENLEVINNLEFDLVYEMHRKEPFDAILMDEIGCRITTEKLGKNHDLPIYFLMKSNYIEPEYAKLYYLRAIPFNLQNIKGYSKIVDIISKSKMLMRIMPELKRRRSQASYELTYCKHNFYEEICISNFSYEQTFDPKNFDNHFIKMPKVPESTLDELPEGSDVKIQFEELHAIIQGKLWEKIDTPRGYLLSGPPGGGKTHAAKALAGACNAYFFHVNAADLIIGDVIKNINHLFDIVTDAAPAVLFIDELDSIACNREKSSQAMTLAVNTLLTRLDGFQKNEAPVFVIGASNLEHKIDPALLRAGRLERVIHVPLPNHQQREKIIKDNLTKYQIDLEPKEIAVFVHQSEGMTIQAIKNSLRDNALQRICNANTPQKLIATDVNTTLDSNTELEKSFRQIAIHEAGHAISIKLANDGLDVEYMWITPPPNLGGATKTNNFKLEIITRERLKQLVQHKLAGRAAEEVILGLNHVSTGASYDLRECTEMVKKAFLQDGMCEKIGFVDLTQLPNAQAAIELEVVEFLKECYQKTLAQLHEHKDLILELANELYLKKSLSKDDVNRIYFRVQSMSNLH